jgi:hypothetical protein
MNLSDMVGRKQAAEGSGPGTDFMNMRKFQPSGRSSENLVSYGAEYERGIDLLIRACGS